MEFKLRFPFMAEPYKVKIGSAKCEIESVKMNQIFGGVGENGGA